MSEMIAVQEALADAMRIVDDLNEVVTEQATRIELLERRVAMLMNRAAEQEADQVSGLPVSDQRPPHY